MLHALFMLHTCHYVNNRLIPGIRMLGYKCLMLGLNLSVVIYVCGTSFE